MDIDRNKRKTKILIIAGLLFALLIITFSIIAFLHQTRAVNRNEGAYLEHMIEYVEDGYEKMDDFMVTDARIYLFSNEEDRKNISVSNHIVIQDQTTGTSYKIIGNEDGQFTVEELAESQLSLKEWKWSEFRKQALAIDYQAYMEGYVFGILTLFDKTAISTYSGNADMDIDVFLWNKNDFAAMENATGSYKGISFIPSSMESDVLDETSGIMSGGQGYIFCSK